jgi:hypothetical protein
MEFPRYKEERRDIHKNISQITREKKNPHVPSNKENRRAVLIIFKKTSLQDRSSKKKNNLLVKTPCENKLHSLMFAYDMVVGFNSRPFIVYLNERESVTITEKNG